MDAVLRNIWVRMCCCCRLLANTIQTVDTCGSIQRLFKMNIITLYNSLQVHVKFRVRIFFFIYFIFYIYLKEWDWTYRRICLCLFTLFRPWDVTGLWKSTQFLLEFALHLLSLVYILWDGPSCPFLLGRVDDFPLFKYILFIVNWIYLHFFPSQI